MNARILPYVLMKQARSYNRVSAQLAELCYFVRLGQIKLVLQADRVTSANLRCINNSPGIGTHEKGNYHSHTQSPTL